MTDYTLAAQAVFAMTRPCLRNSIPTKSRKLSERHSSCTPLHHYVDASIILWFARLLRMITHPFQGGDKAESLCMTSWSCDYPCTWWLTMVESDKQPTRPINQKFMTLIMIWDTVLFSFDVMDNSERAIKAALLRLARLLFYSRSISSRIFQPS